MTDPPPHPAGHLTDRLLGTSPAMAALRAQIHRLRSFDAVGSPHVPTVLLQGETGTGKNLVALIVHNGGPRAAGPFIEVNCAAIPATMLEAELFGFEPGAFTDAKRAKPGLFEAALGGTLFLDEIDALPLVLQGKLLTALESRRVRRLGAVAERAVDVKLIASTNAILPAAVAAGRFRADLYHRLAVVVLTLPPLRERGTDSLVLAQEFLRQYGAAHGVPPQCLSVEAEAWLQSYGWPGNVRELSHVMERVTLLHAGQEVDAETLTRLCQPSMAPVVTHKTVPVAQESVAERAFPAEAEQIRRALAQTGGNVARAARLLGVSRDQVRYRMQRYGIERPHLRTPLPPASTPSPRMGARDPHPEGDRLPPEPDLALTESPRRRAARRREAENNAATDRNVTTPSPVWAQKPVAVLALEVIWPEADGPESSRYNAWTEMARWDASIMERVHGFGGMLVQRTASLLTWVFGLPQAVEQLPQRAVHAALSIRRMVAEANAPTLRPAPEVRLAAHLGAVRVDIQSPDWVAHMLAVGETLALPVRLLGQAAMGELLVSPEVGRLVEGCVTLEARPLHLRPGDPTRVGGYAIVGMRPARLLSTASHAPPHSPFVGRERELALLEAVWAQVKAGRGQVVSMVGAPGMGKSRLLAEFRQRLAGQLAQFAEGQCLAYGTSIPYLPIVDLLRAYCGVTVDDRPERLVAMVRNSLQWADLDPDANLPYLLHVLGVPVDVEQLSRVSAEARKARAFEIFRQLFLGASRQQPLFLAVENLHWIDPTSEELLTSLVEALAGASILLLATFRPGYSPRWLDKSYATQIALQPLRSDHGRQIVRAMVRRTDLTPALEQQLLIKAQGNPFFLEELAHTLDEHGGQSLTVAVPDTVQAVIAARIDGLPAEEKHLLEAASVIGENVSLPLLQAMTAIPEGALSRHLKHLQAAEFLSAASGLHTSTYTFRHILIQETAYQSLASSTRRQYHRQLAQALVERFSELTETQPELLAHHYTAAGDAEQAIDAWQRAGQRAAERSSYLEAITHFTTALTLLQRLPDTSERAQQELALRLALGPALIATKGQTAPEVEQTYTRARELCQQEPENPQFSQILTGLVIYHQGQGEHQTAQEISLHLLRLAQRINDPVFLLHAHACLGLTALYQGNLVESRVQLEQGSTLGEHLTHLSLTMNSLIDLAVVCQVGAAWALQQLGYPDQAERRGEDALRLARRVASPFNLCNTLFFLALWRTLRREWHVARQFAEEALHLPMTPELLFYSAIGQIIRGATFAAEGRAEEGLMGIRQGLAACHNMGVRVLQPWGLAMLAESYARLRQPEAGLTALAEAQALMPTTGEAFYAAEIARLQGELLSQSGRQAPNTRWGVSPAATMETCFQQALEVARSQQAKSWELRAAISLSRLWHGQGKRQEARQLLGDVYHWFTEGFDTPDLREARALLAELGD